MTLDSDNGRTTQMANFDSYKNTFPHAKLIRSSNGVLEVMLHTNGDTLIFNGYTHEEFVDLFHQISQDAGNRAVILTGAGKAFIDNIDAEGFDFGSPRGYDKIYREGKKVFHRPAKSRPMYRKSAPRRHPRQTAG
jgi:enoyl-CoA hydratase/carnithine racemase